MRTAPLTIWWLISYFGPGGRKIGLLISRPHRKTTRRTIISFSNYAIGALSVAPYISLYSVKVETQFTVVFVPSSETKTCTLLYYDTERVIRRY